MPYKIVALVSEDNKVEYCGYGYISYFIDRPYKYIVSAFTREALDIKLLTIINKEQK